jgi:lysozyme
MTFLQWLQSLIAPKAESIRSESGTLLTNSLREKLTTQLRRDEGEVLHAYTDSLGYLTIGIGRLIDKRKGGGITKAESAYLFANDLDSKRAEVRRRIPWFDRLDTARQGVLLNMAFQMGVDGLLGFKNTLAMIERGDYAGAAAGMLNSLWAEQTPERAKRLSIQMATGAWQ